MVCFTKLWNKRFTKAYTWGKRHHSTSPMVVIGSRLFIIFLSFNLIGEFFRFLCSSVYLSTYPCVCGIKWIYTQFAGRTASTKIWSSSFSRQPFWNTSAKTFGYGQSVLFCTFKYFDYNKKFNVCQIWKVKWQ